MRIIAKPTLGPGEWATWTRVLHLEVLGCRIRVRSSDAAVADTIARLFDAFTIAPAPCSWRTTVSVFPLEDRRWAAVLGSRTLAVAEAPTELTADIAAGINRAAIAAYRGFAAHAGAVSLDGAAVCFPGDSGAGKSTLTAACLCSGFEYVSDEAVCLSWGTTNVNAYPKPLALSPWAAEKVGLELDESELRSMARSGETLFGPSRLGARIAKAPVRLAHVVRMRRADGPPDLHETASGAIVTELLRASFNHYKDPEGAFRTVTGVARQAQCWDLTYDDPVAAAELLRRRLPTPLR